MLKACQYCGRIHSKKTDCLAKIRTLRERDAVQRERESEIRTFRSSGVWKRKAKAVIKRDKGLCLVCRAELDSLGRCTGTLIGAEVHHIVPLSVEFSARLEEENLITLCRVHHEDAERGDILAEYLKGLVSAASAEYPPGGEAISGGLPGDRLPPHKHKKLPK